MVSINWLRVFLGGIVAGLVICVSGFSLGHFVLGPEYIVAFKEKFPPSSPAMMAVQHFGMRIWFGILAVYLYAVFRTRFGPYPRTAIIVGVTMWASIGVVLLVTLSQLKLLGGWKLAVTAAWTLIEFCLAALAGASLYRE